MFTLHFSIVNLMMCIFLYTVYTAVSSFLVTTTPLPTISQPPSLAPTPPLFVFVHEHAVVLTPPCPAQGKLQPWHVMLLHRPCVSHKRFALASGTQSPLVLPLETIKQKACCWLQTQKLWRNHGAPLLRAPTAAQPLQSGHTESRHSSPFISIIPIHVIRPGETSIVTKTINNKKRSVLNVKRGPLGLEYEEDVLLTYLAEKTYLL